MKIAWAKNFDRECGHEWEAKPGETVAYEDENGLRTVVAARGGHRCVKDLDHVSDITADDHQCCCGNSTWVP